MILTRTPLRVSLFGGGSDLPGFYNTEPGRVISTTIDKYMYIALCKTAYEGIKVVYNEIETAQSLSDIKHSRVRETLDYFDINSHIEISSFCEIPTKGTGLGSSSTFTVGLINAVSRLKNIDLTKCDIAEDACHIEMYRCMEPIGKQDQYAAAYGGFNVFEFDRDGVKVIKPSISYITRKNLNDRLMMFYTGVTRNTSDILSVQSNNINYSHTRRMVDLSAQAEIALTEGSIEFIGEMLHEAWALKREFTPNTSNDFIDAYYSKALHAGAKGGKILGAGGGGYFLFYVPVEKQESVRQALSPLKEFKFNFEDTGTTVVYDESKPAF